MIYGAADRNRTGTGVAPRGILSPLRLPIPPQRRVATVYEENIIETNRFVKKNVRNHDSCAKNRYRGHSGQGTDAGMNRRRGSKPLLNNNVLLHGDRGDGAAVDSLLTVAGVAGIGIDDPGLVVS